MNLRPLAALVSLGFLAAFCGAKDKKAASPPGLPVTAGVVEKIDVPLEAVAVGHVDAFSTVAVRTRVGGEVTRVGFREGQDRRYARLAESRTDEALVHARETDDQQPLDRVIGLPRGLRLVAEQRFSFLRSP